MPIMFCPECDDSVFVEVGREPEDHFVCAPGGHYVSRDSDDVQSVWDRAFGEAE